MRIALITKAFSYNMNDWCAPPVVDFVRALSDEVEIDIYTLYYPHQARVYDLFGAHVVALDLWKKHRLGRYAGYRAAAARIGRAHASRPYDLIHAIWADSPGMVGARVAQATGLPLVTTLYAGETVSLPEIGYGVSQRPRHRRALERTLQVSAAVTSGSKTLSDHVQTSFRIAPRTIPLGLCSERLAQSQRPIQLDGKIKLLTAASLNSVKGLDVIMDALHRIARSSPGLMENLRWHLVGPDAVGRDARNTVLQRIGALPVTVHEGQPHWDMSHIYSAADLALIGSHFESQCFAAMEPVACGRPAFGTAVGILPEMVSPDWLCAPGDAVALAHLIERVATTPERWGAERERQNDWLQASATLGVAKARFLDLYREVVDTAREDAAR